MLAQRLPSILPDLTFKEYKNDGTLTMAGELNKGDAVVYRKYNDQTIQEGQVIVFEKNPKALVNIFPIP